MPTLVLLAGPNGSGKTTFINRFLRPPSADFSVMRVARRVAQGGHGIPEDTLRRRFTLSLDYLEAVYKPLVNSWEVYAVSDEGLVLLECSPR